MFGIFDWKMTLMIHFESSSRLIVSAVSCMWNLTAVVVVFLFLFYTNWWKRPSVRDSIESQQLARRWCQDFIALYHSNVLWCLCRFIALIQAQQCDVKSKSHYPPGCCCRIAYIEFLIQDCFYWFVGSPWHLNIMMTHGSHCGHMWVLSRTEVR